MHRIRQYRKDLQDWLHGIRTTEPDPLTYGISIDIAQLIVNHERNLYLNNKTPETHAKNRNHLPQI